MLPFCFLLSNRKFNLCVVGASGPGRGDAAQAALVRRVREGQIPSTRLHLVRKLMEQADCTLFSSTVGARRVQTLFLYKIYHKCVLYVMYTCHFS